MGDRASGPFLVDLEIISPHKKTCAPHNIIAAASSSPLGSCWFRSDSNIPSNSRNISTAALPLVAPFAVKIAPLTLRCSCKSLPRPCNERCGNAQFASDQGSEPEVAHLAIRAQGGSGGGGEGVRHSEVSLTRERQALTTLPRTDA